MKKLIFLIALFLFASCGEDDEVTIEENIGLKDSSYIKFEYGAIDVYHIQEIDGCEYILVNGRENTEPALTHKGNCKYCLERNKQSTEEVKEKEEVY